MAITVPIGVPLFFLAALLTGQLGDVPEFSTQGIRGARGRRHSAFRVGPLLQLPRHARDRHQPGRADPAGQPARHALVLAIWLLGEELTPLKLLGIALVLIGPALTMRERREDKTPTGERNVSDEKITAIDAEKPPEFEPKYAEGYHLRAPVCDRLRLQPDPGARRPRSKGLGASFAGGLVAYIAATVVMALILLWPGQLRQALAVNRESAKWFTLSGFLVFLSQMFLYMAMSVAPVTVVSPINRLSILFRLYFSRWLNPQHEVFGGKRDRRHRRSRSPVRWRCR